MLDLSNMKKSRAPQNWQESSFFGWFFLNFFKFDLFVCRFAVRCSLLYTDQDERFVVLLDTSNKGTDTAYFVLFWNFTIVVLKYIQCKLLQSFFIG
jgi:hypothetical protein